MAFKRTDVITEEEAAQLPLPLDLFEPSREVRPEYNIGKFAGVIFTSPYAKNVREARTHSWTVTNGDQKLDASLTITPLVGLKTPTTTTLRVYLALIQVWEHMGRPEDGIVQFSARQLAAVIGWKWAGKDTAERIYDHLKVLSGTSLSWVLAYTRKDKKIDEIYDDMSILASASYRKRNQLFEPEKFSTVQRIRFNPDLVENMLAGHVRPLNYEAFRQIGNDTNANLYTRLDIFLATNPKYERRAFELLTEDLGLTGARYKSRRARKAKLKEFEKELDGVALLKGQLKLAVQETADKQDWKLVAWKVERALPKRKYVKPTNDAEFAEYLADEIIDEIRSQPQAGTPRRGYIVFLCKLYEERLVREALSIAKADYRGNVKTTLVAVFVSELKRAVKAQGLEWPEKHDAKDAR